LVVFVCAGIKDIAIITGADRSWSISDIRINGSFNTGAISVIEEAAGIVIIGIIKYFDSAGAGVAISAISSRSARINFS